MKTTTKLRSLLKEAPAKTILEQLWANKDQNDILVHLAVTESCINGSVSMNQSRQWLPENLLEKCYIKFDGPFFTELRTAKVISKFSFGEGDLPNRPPDENNQVAQVSGINLINLKYLLDWIGQLPFILSRGDFSLNTLSGHAFYKEHEARFYKNTSYFKLLKSFLEQKDCKLSISEMLRIKGVESQILKQSKEDYETAKEMIKNLSRSLGINNINKVFPYTGDSFVLST